MTAPPQTNAQGNDTSAVNITEEDFLKLLESDMMKVEAFTLARVTELRNKLKEIEDLINSGDDLETKYVGQEADTIAETFLRIEKYVNINFMGFHKVRRRVRGKDQIQGVLHILNVCYYRFSRNMTRTCRIWPAKSFTSIVYTPRRGSGVTTRILLCVCQTCTLPFVRIIPLKKIRTPHSHLCDR